MKLNNEERREWHVDFPAEKQALHARNRIALYFKFILEKLPMTPPMNSYKTPLLQHRNPWPPDRIPLFHKIEGLGLLDKNPCSIKKIGTSEQVSINECLIMAPLWQPGPSFWKFFQGIYFSMRADLNHYKGPAPLFKKCYNQTILIMRRPLGIAFQQVFHCSKKQHKATSS